MSSTINQSPSINQWSKRSTFPQFLSFCYTLVQFLLLNISLNHNHSFNQWLKTSTFPQFLSFCCFLVQLLLLCISLNHSLSFNQWLNISTILFHNSWSFVTLSFCFFFHYVLVKIAPLHLINSSKYQFSHHNFCILLFSRSVSFNMYVCMYVVCMSYIWIKRIVKRKSTGPSIVYISV